ncbi:MAG: hypothetical protein E8D41_01545 [Nitrospira sp.]|nr:MAG: hypothetical protein E8D41_01545 [Nitrospira sp.]
MIHLLPPLSLDGRFSTQDLPNELQLTLLNNMIMPRIVSSSMLPTIQEGDRLELSPPTSLTVGEIVVFRNNTLLICHRITAIDPHGTLSTRGDATRGACEIVQPGAVIGVVTGVFREGALISLGNSPHISSATAQPRRLDSRVRTMVVRSITRSIGVPAKLPLFQPMLALLLRWIATVDVLAPTSLQSLPSHAKVASFALRGFPQNGELLAPSNGQKPTRYIVRLGPWRLAQYDPATDLLLLRQSLRDAGLEPLIRSLLR